MIRGRSSASRCRPHASVIAACDNSRDPDDETRMFEKDSLSLLRGAVDTMERGYATLPAFVPPFTDDAAIAKVLRKVALRLRDDYPYFHPLYAGQMQSPPHSVARLAYALALFTNPNNHATAGGRASVRMEREAIAGIARMIGWSRFTGHLCGGGTLANAEALWVSGQHRRRTTVVASEHAHYAHERMSRVLGLPFESIRGDGTLRLDVDALCARLERGDVGAVVATIGTTASGSVDPLPELLALRDRYGFRLHADAAYGGYFTLVDDLSASTRAAFDRLGEVDSIVIDPHKHGLQPYGCSSVLFRDPADGRFLLQRSPCSDSDTTSIVRETGFECSRPGAAAVALWATMQLLPLVKGGEFARMLAAGRAAALALYDRLAHDRRFVAPMRPDLDIVVFAMRSRRPGGASRAARRVLAECARRNLHLSLVELPRRLFPDASPKDGAGVICLRCTLMKPVHQAWVDGIFDIISQSATAVEGQ
jgi:glutamate/tyrosine decarboxylase-like PLP-dependent enzyme